jgi:hypothetical protein
MIVDLVALPHWHLREFSRPLAHATFDGSGWTEWFAPPETRLVLAYIDGELAAGFWS